jgi:hypothetical protein
MKNLKRHFIAFFALLLTITSSLNAQGSEKIKVNVGTDLVSNYIWRGVPSLSADSVGNSQLSPNFEPGLSVVIGGLTIGAWGSYDFLGKYHETDLYASYAFGPVAVTLTDYYWTYGSKYFNYKSDETAHILEGAVAFLGTEKLPLTLSVATFLYGADKKYLTDPKETDLKKQNFSTYIEAGYSFGLGSSKLNPFIGITPTDGYYGDGYGNVDGFQVVNIGATASKSMEFSEKVSIPVKLSLIYNPVMEKSFLVVGLTF